MSSSRVSSAALAFANGVDGMYFWNILTQREPAIRLASIIRNSTTMRVRSSGIFIEGAFEVFAGGMAEGEEGENEYLARRLQVYGNRE